MSRLMILAGILAMSFSVLPQEKMAVSRQDFSGGITVAFDSQQLAAVGDFLAVSDSTGHQLALLNIVLDGQKRWLRMSKDAPEPDNVVHWHFDEENGQLVIDLSKLKDAINGQSTLSISVAVLNTRNSRFKLSAHDAEKPAADQLSVLAKIKDVDIDVQ